MISPTTPNIAAGGKSHLFQDALDFAIHAHRGQKRKYTNLPYAVHPIDVAKIVSLVRPEDEEMIAAALLHDVVEDCGIAPPAIEGLFGKRVRDLVMDLTDVSKPEDGNRAQRRHIDLLHTAKAHPDAKTIKLADLLDNTKDIVEHGGDFTAVYMAEKRLLLEVLKEGDQTLWNRANDRVTQYFASR